MTILDQQTVNPEFIKSRWGEPYVSNALNRKHFKTTPRGVYRGFELIAGPGETEITVGGAASGDVSGYQGGAFDAASGWSIAVHESLDGYGTVLAQYGASGYVFDAGAYRGSDVWLAIDVQYGLGFPTASQIKLVDSTELDANPTLVSLGKATIPAIGPVTQPNIDYDDPLYPRVLPYANIYKDGYMSQAQAQIVEALKTPNASNAFEVEYEVVTPGPQTILIPGGNSYVVGGFDLKVFRNGIRKIRGRDYNEIDDGSGFGTSIQWIGPLKAEDRVFFNGQRYAVALVNNLSVLDEDALVQTNVTRLNFSGTGVLVIPDGTGQAKVIIPSVAGGGAKKQKLNATGVDIPAYRCVNLKSDGTIEPTDPRILDHEVYGITAQEIENGEYGDVFLDGVALYALSTCSGFIPGDIVYVDDSGSGCFSPTPPDPLTSQVLRVGIADVIEATSGGAPVDIIFDRQNVI